MKKIFFAVSMIFLLIACSNGNKNNTDSAETEDAQEKQLNISILLDLSDRISPEKFPAIPEHLDRDLENIKTITEFFKSDMERLGAYKAKGKIRVFFSPPPVNPEINSIAGKLSINCSKMDSRGRKEVFDSITSIFSQYLEKIYSQTILTSDWGGSDIWRFFKDDIKDFCIEKNPNFRNVLIVFTDGYIYHRQSIYNRENRFSYVLDSNLRSYRRSNWRQIIEQNDFGIMTERDDLNDLEVLVLELSAENPNNKIDEDIISFVWKKWLAEMNVSRYEVYRSDLPENTKSRIENFLIQK